MKGEKSYIYYAGNTFSGAGYPWPSDDDIRVIQKMIEVVVMERVEEGKDRGVEEQSFVIIRVDEKGNKATLDWKTGEEI